MVQRNKKKSKEAFREKFVKWHAPLSERLVRTGAKELATRRNEVIINVISN